jgi:MFS family permease
MSQARRRALEVLRHTAFVRYLSARLLATLAAQIQTVAVGWQVYEITRDPLDLGLIGLSQFLPFVVLILPAGQIADRYDRRRIVMLCYATETLCAMLLLLFTMFEITNPVPVFGAMTLLGCARAFSMPTGQALLPNLVPAEDFSRAVALNSSVFQISTIAGPALGGLIYLAGPSVVYTCVGLLAATATLLMLRVVAPQAPVRLRCCPFSRPTSCTSARSDSACCARRRGSARPCARCGSRFIRSHATSVIGCSPVCSYSAARRSCSA